MIEDESIRTFVIESRELLESMESALLQIEQNPEDADLLNALFRAAHTIKGSAGLFGFDHVVSFTHHAENVLDRVRNGALHVTGDLIALLLQICDHMNALISGIESGQPPGEDLLARSQVLIGQLQKFSDQAPPAATQALAHEIPPVTRLDMPDQVKTDNWHISLRFDQGVLKNGMDPMSFIRYLTTLGEIISIVTLTDALPPAAEMDAESCYLGFELNFRSEADKATIESAFEFVRDDARIRILPPRSKASEYLTLIQALPEEDMRLGEILVRCGTLTHTELQHVLAEQQAQGPTPEPIGQMLVEQQLVQPDVAEAALVKQKQIKDNALNQATMIRVNADKLDEHINLIGELIIASASINLTATTQGDSELQEAASVLNRLVESVRDSALQLRMVQIGATFSKFQRVVRDVSKELDKDIHLEISGADTELDKTVVEKIGDPLTHLVRNSMDHGIEPVEVRLARGKPAHGTLGLNAYHDSGSIVIEVSDDGGGLPRDKILAKALEKGLIKPDQVLTDSEIHALIFEPGLTTAKAVNNLSGRGVGMDVVRRNIAALRGSIEIQSTEGQGSTFRIRLPLTLAIIDGFLVGVGKSSFILPLDMVVECVELTADELHAAQGRNQLNLRGEVLPFIRLRELFDIAEHSQPASGPAMQASSFSGAQTRQASRRDNIVVVNYAGRRAGLLVDDLQGEYQTVIRPLGTIFNGLQGVSGFTILGNGQVALILDVPGLIQRITQHETQHRQPALLSSRTK